MRVSEFSLCLIKNLLGAHPSPRSVSVVLLKRDGDGKKWTWIHFRDIYTVIQVFQVGEAIRREDSLNVSVSSIWGVILLSFVDIVFGLPVYGFHPVPRPQRMKFIFSTSVDQIKEIADGEWNYHYKLYLFGNIRDSPVVSGERVWWLIEIKVKLFMLQEDFPDFWSRISKDHVLWNYYRYLISPPKVDDFT